MDENKEDKIPVITDNAVGEPSDEGQENSQLSSDPGKEPNSGDEKEIDLLELFHKLWMRKKMILIWCMWGVLAGLIIAFSIPKEYSTSIKLAPEAKNGRAAVSGGLGALASMAGISAGGNTSSDAVYPQLYPDIVGSVPFILSLLDVPVTDQKDQHYTIREYLLDKTRRPWWNAVMGAPRKAIGFVLSGGGGSKDKGEKDTLMTFSAFKLSPEDDGLVGELRQRVTASVDQKTNVITIEAQMQDPMVSAILADTVVARLQEYVTNYRTDKARQDLVYALKLNDEAQDEYYKAQQRLADYTDRNQNIATQSARITRDRLENEASLAFNLYNETALQVQNAKSRVQEYTPVYTTIIPATVPMRPTSPRKGLIIGGCTFLAFIACCAWILFGSPLLKEFKEKGNKNKLETNN